MKLAIIPARGGSKRIPRKNIRPFFGKPMLAYAISAAQESGLFAHIVVSTDDEEIAGIANALGAETPFRRPPDLANDTTATVPVIAHAAQACAGLGWSAEYVCCIYPCAPFLCAADLKAVLAQLIESGRDYAFPVTTFPSAVQRALRRTGSGCMEPLYPEFELTRTQDLEPAYYDAGQFYWGKATAWMQHKRIHSGGVGYLIPSWRVVDIDTLDDWKRAERLAPLMEMWTQDQC